MGTCCGLFASGQMELRPGSLIWAKFPGSSWYPALLDALEVQLPGKPIKHEVHFAFPSESDWGGDALNPKFIRPFTEGFKAYIKPALRNPDLMQAVVEAISAYKALTPDRTVTRSTLCAELQIDRNYFRTHL